MLTDTDRAATAYMGGVLAANITSDPHHFDHIAAAAETAYATILDQAIAAETRPHTRDQHHDAHEQAYNAARDAAYGAQRTIPAYETLAA